MVAQRCPRIILCSSFVCTQSLADIANYWVNTRFFAETAAEKREVWAPTRMKYEDPVSGEEGNFIHYGEVIPDLLIILTIALPYCTISPVQIPFTCAFFVVRYLHFRYKILFWHEPLYESQGELWWFAKDKIVQAMYIYLAIMAWIFLSKGAPFMACGLLLIMHVVYDVSDVIDNRFKPPALSTTSLDEFRQKPGRSCKHALPSVAEMAERCAYAYLPYAYRKDTDKDVRKAIGDIIHLPSNVFSFHNVTFSPRDVWHHPDGDVASGIRSEGNGQDELDGGNAPRHDRDVRNTVRKAQRSAETTTVEEDKTLSKAKSISQIKKIRTAKRKANGPTRQGSGKEQLAQGTTELRQRSIKKNKGLTKIDVAEVAEQDTSINVEVGHPLTRQNTERRRARVKKLRSFLRPPSRRDKLQEAVDTGPLKIHQFKSPVVQEEDGVLRMFLNYVGDGST